MTQKWLFGCFGRNKLKRGKRLKIGHRIRLNRLGLVVSQFYVGLELLGTPQWFPAFSLRGGVVGVPCCPVNGVDCYDWDESAICAWRNF